jgi:hypothetical protein
LKRRSRINGILAPKKKSALFGGTRVSERLTRHCEAAFVPGLAPGDLMLAPSIRSTISIEEKILRIRPEWLQTPSLDRFASREAVLD